MTYLTKIKFTAGPWAGEYGYQETSGPDSTTLLHLYACDGDQLDGGNGYFPNAKWEALPHSVYINDSDDFWNAIESLQFAE